MRSDILACQGASAPPLEKAYVHNPFPHYIPDMNASRQWLLLDDKLNVVKRLSSQEVQLEAMRRHKMPGGEAG